MADESSEGRRFSYKKKQTNKRPTKKVDERAERPTREKRPVGKVKRGGGEKPSDDFVHGHTQGSDVRNNFPRKTDTERRIDRDQRRRYELTAADSERSSRMEGLPRPIIEQKRPPGGPTPMIQPQVGPVGQIRSQAAHTYGYTPEAYKELRKTPIRMAPPTNDFEEKVGGYYNSRENQIYINPSNPGEDMRNLAQTLGHEQAHTWYDQSGLATPEMEPGYQKRFGQWRDQAVMPNNQRFENAASYADEDLREAMGRTDLYDRPHPTEQYARTVEFTPNEDRGNWPDEIRPYYSGFLQGMDRLSTGEPTPPPVRGSLYDFQPEGPDENGAWGSPIRRWR